MKCPNCNDEIKENYNYCKNCGKEIIKNNTSKPVIEVNNQTFKRRNSHPWIIVSIFVFILVALFVGLITLAIIEDEQTTDTPNQETRQNEDKTTDRRIKEKTKTVHFNNYTFTISSDQTTSVSGSQLFIYGKNNEWTAVVKINEGKYEELISYKDELKTILLNQNESENYDITNATIEETKYNEHNFIVIKNIKLLSQNIELTYSKAGDNSIFATTLTKNDGTEFVDSEKNEIYTIISSATKDV